MFSGRVFRNTERTARVNGQPTLDRDDLVDVGVTGEAELGDRLKARTELRVIGGDGVAGDDPKFLGAGERLSF